jgi:TPP-dependent 2-oxoacid decarboxylase
MGKFEITESTSHFIGLYAGVLSNSQVREVVEDSDCILNLGAMLTELITGIFATQLGQSRIIVAPVETVTTRLHQYAGTLSTIVGVTRPSYYRIQRILF